MNALATMLTWIWSRVPETVRRRLRPLFWNTSTLRALRRHAPWARTAMSERRGDAGKSFARLRIREAIQAEKSGFGLLSALVRLAVREPRTMATAASPTDVIKLLFRIRAPDGSRTASRTPETRVQLEVRLAAARAARSLDLAEARPFALQRADEPEVSIVIPVWNRWQLTYRCLASIASNASGIAYEVVVVDNGSDDETEAILSRIENARVLRNSRNLGFLLASNQGASAARGKYLLFLNNDTQVLSETLPALLAIIKRDPSVGAVGGRIISLDGRLQEAGSIVWSDGSCLGYGRGDDPFAPAYSYVREVDYCSGALLLTPRELFIELGTFDLRYAPAYYEDADYCMAVRGSGRRVMYQPAATIVHHEFGSAPRREDAVDAQLRNRRLFVEKWNRSLGERLSPSTKNVLAARDASHRPRLLLVDDRVPDPRLGCGFPRTYRMLTLLQELGWAVTFFPLQEPVRVEPCTNELEGAGVEMMTGAAERKLDLRAFLQERGGLYDVIVISRPHNMREVMPFIRAAAPASRIVYDAEAIYAHRELRLLELRGVDVAERTAQAMIRDELALVRYADAVVAASRVEASAFEAGGGREVAVVGHAVDVRPTETAFALRSDLLFVGAVLVSPSPNEDALLFFLESIFPRLRDRLGCSLYIVGTNRSPILRALRSDGVHVVGTVDDLQPWYSRSRVFVVPTRYAAGIPLKLLDASAFGLPSVVTPLIAHQVGWTDGREVLVGPDPDGFVEQVVRLYRDRALWEGVRSRALAAVGRECSRSAFLDGLREATMVGALRGPAAAQPQTDVGTTVLQQVSQGGAGGA